jgi:hypothetical protein
MLAYKSWRGTAPRPGTTLGAVPGGGGHQSVGLPAE